MKGDHALRGSTVALVNSHSGERTAARYLQEELRKELGDDCVLDLMVFVRRRVDPADGVSKEKAEFVSKNTWDTAAPDPSVERLLNKLAVIPGGGHVIVAGGDGTVAWGMSLIDEHYEREPSLQRPYVAVVPMGTGNDLSRALGWGPGFVKGGSSCCGSSEPVKDMLSLVAAGHRSVLDRWTVEVLDRHGNSARKSVIMNNYLSVGFDARITHQFDTFRDDNPHLCKHRAVNKVWYAKFGCQALCGSPQIKQRVTVTVDGKTLDQKRIAELKSVVCTNIDSYASGMKPWRHRKNCKHGFSEPVFHDGKLEVCGYFGPWHLGLSQIRMRTSKKIGQGSVVVMEMSPEADLDYLRLQIDGEAINNLPEGGCTIRITRHPGGGHRVLTKRSKLKRAASVVSIAPDEQLFHRSVGSRPQTGKNGGEAAGPFADRPPVMVIGTISDQEATRGVDSGVMEDA
ncbi:Diacylglycerol kinase 1 [Diplonema papillatum]|nr:Diacylglycerol kinase 1 [Diplonema papillatum]